ncbi:MAG: ketopantoate reductase family protein [Oscillospiraceae bacterium]|nr:ketopantoate reductase family protein [Oscillospiraceae bacterium]
MKEIKTVAIVGMGALGILFGSRMAEQIGFENVSYVMDEARCLRSRGKAVYCNDQPLVFNCLTPEEAKPADLVVVAVKYTGLEAALDVMAGCVGEDTVIISVLNGISSEEIIARRYGWDRVLYSVAVGMDAMRFGDRLTYTKMGMLALGTDRPEMKGQLERLTRFFDRAQVPYQVDEDILHRLWGKFMLNVGVNQTCMVFSCTFSDVWREGKERQTMLGAMEEVIAVAGAKGITLTGADLEEYDRLIRTLAPNGTPSMGQDRINRRPSEVEMFAGMIIAMGREHNVPTPVNQWLYEQVKEIEAQYV